MIFQEVEQILKSHKKELFKLGVLSLSLFGSTARDEGSNSSDVDILIKFDPKKGLFAFVFLRDYLKNLLGCKVDLVTKNALHPALKKKILNEAKLVF